MTASEADFLLARPKWWSERRDECKEWRNAFIPPAKVSPLLQRRCERACCWLLVVIRRFIAYNWKLDVEKA